VLKVRVMPTLLYRGATLVKGIGFDSWRPVGAAMQAIKVYNLREVDELVFVDIRATLEKRGPDLQLIDELADECFAPLTVGGGITNVEDVRGLLAAGADKVAVNTAGIESPDLISDIADAFGSQCVVQSIDVRRSLDGSVEVLTASGTRPTGLAPVDVAREAERNGVGEILLTSIDRDGTMTGYDLELIAQVTSAVRVPVIASGGAGTYEDMRRAVEDAGASAVAAASIFHFTQQTPLEAKRYLASAGVPVRL
jgi:imidazole glycerol-phosphate synthase subunit HisF